VLGASFDTPADNKAFADAQGFKFQLLADPARTVGTAYEVLRGESDPYAAMPQRIAYLIDPQGVIREHYLVKDVDGFAGQVLDDLRRLAAS
jgi:peroxiredoxin